MTKEPIFLDDYYLFQIEREIQVRNTSFSVITYRFVIAKLSDMESIDLFGDEQIASSSPLKDAMGFNPSSISIIM